MEKYIQILKKCSLFDGISEQDIPKLLGCLQAKVICFDKKESILSEGCHAKHVGIILSGTAQIVQVDYYGNRSIFSDVKQAEIFGEAFACAGVEYLPVSVIANEACEVMLIDCERILHTCAKACGFHQQIFFNLMRDIATKAIIFQQKIEVISKRSTREKLMSYLQIQARKAGSSSFEIPFDRQELADYLEVDRSGLSAEISRMRKEGIIKSTKNSFELL